MSPSHCPPAFRAIGNADSESLINCNELDTIRTLSNPGAKMALAFQALRERNGHLLNFKQIQTGSSANGSARAN